MNPENRDEALPPAALGILAFIFVDASHQTHGRGLANASG